MTTSPPITRNYQTWLVVLGSLAAGAAYTWYAGEDANWDWRNYHDYNAYAWIHGFWDRDVAPGGIQTFLNPLPYLPAYLLRHHVGAPLWGMILGAIHGLNLALIYVLSRRLLGSAATAFTLASTLLIAAFGPMTLSEVGTSFADVLTALPVIAGLALILSAESDERARYVVAGLLIGGAVGLKLTNMAFLIGAFVAVLLAAQPLSALGFFALGAMLAGLAAGGEWCWTLWREFGNPVFPFYNSIFRSPEAAPLANADLRFLPDGLWDALTYPFDWLVGKHPSSEGPFRDPRFALVFLLLIATLIVAAIRRNAILARRDKQFLLFFFVAYEAWLLEFSIHRYAIVLELLCAPVIVLLICRLWSGFQAEGPPRRRYRVVNLLTVIAAVGIALWSQPADWTRRPWSAAYHPKIPQALREPATFMLIEKPVGYVVPMLSPASRSYQIADIVMPIVPGGILDRRIRRGLADPLPGGVWAVHLRGSPLRQGLLENYRLKLDSSRACENIEGADGADIEICPLTSAL